MSQPQAPVKRRACDECRTRKLACSKDDDGCARCRRERIVCHYSEQKVMGRPRKRQREDLDNAALDAAPFHARDDNADPYIDPIDAFLNGNAQPEEANVLDPELYSKNGIAYSRWQFGGSMSGPPIDYGNYNSRSEGALVSGDLGPQLYNGSSSDSTGSPPPPLPIAPQETVTPCGCLASMYLSLASLQQLPSDSILALKAVRGAAYVAAASIWCPQCGSVAVNNPNPPIEMFQNTMLLGTILPIIANGYQTLLRIIDDETNAAEAAGQTKVFRFRDYGGMCGSQSSVAEAINCAEKEIFFQDIEMPANQWRATVRALLRVDIYGHEQGGFRHKGLKDLLSEMEARQQARHSMLDEAHAAGMSGHGMFGQNCAGKHDENSASSSIHACLQILGIAKAAIDNLVIA